MINKDTKLCISVSSRPSNFGTSVHNAGYKDLGINYIYKAFETNNIKDTMAGVRALGIRGCSVSMPFKETVIKYLDTLDETADKVGAVNTVLNESGQLIGYNTDVIGAKVALESLKLNTKNKVLVLGAGGMAKAILYALNQLGFTNIHVSNRSELNFEKLNNIFPCQFIKWDDRENESADIVINATSVGMSPEDDICPLSLEYIQNSNAIIDVVLTPMETMLISMAKANNIKFVPGYLISLEQAMAQFQIYTGTPPNRNVMLNKVLELLNN
ncbi:MAG: shikimate dehydrogenase [Planctomycetota bacterium]|nr:MAG: shikimate dehydrogenase [Planctomycetota bacterium]